MNDYHYQNVLAATFQQRKAHNARYSMRAFARSLGLDVGLLSKVLAGKQILSIGSGRKVARSLALAAEETNLFLDSLGEAQKQQRLGKQAADASAHLIRRIEQDSIAVIGELHHFAIMELCCASNFDGTSRMAARRLGITVIEADQAIARLLRLGLVERSQEGKLAKTDKHVQLADPAKTTPLLKKQQREILTAAREALNDQEIERRSTTGMTMCIDAEKIPLAKIMINKFMFELCEALEAGGRKEVYQLSVSLFSLEPNRSAHK